MEKKLNILIAEDNSVMRKVIKSLVADSMKEVELFEIESGDEVIGTVKEKNIDWLFLDLYLPKINGDKIIEEIKNDSSCDNVKIIVISAESNKTRIMDLLKTERISNYLPKPINKERLQLTIEELLKES